MDKKRKYYQTWRDMLRRCDAMRRRKRESTYVGSTVCDEWLILSNFTRWMKTQDWQGKHLDKDIMYPGNKVYGPDTCVFVNGATNLLLTDHRAARGPHPQGVTYVKRDKKYRSQVKKGGKPVILGHFDNPEEASKVYREAKRLHILTVACCELDIRVKQGLYRHSELFR